MMSWFTSFVGFTSFPRMTYIPDQKGLFDLWFSKSSSNFRLKLYLINHGDHAEALRQHDLETLCDTFHQLLYQFPPDTQMCCIIDTFPLFDTDMWFDDLAVVMQCLRYIVVDRRSLPPLFIRCLLLSSPASRSTDITSLPL